MKDDVDHTLAMECGIHSTTMCKWTINLEAKIYMNPHRMIFDAYEIIILHKVYFGDNNFVRAIGKSSITIKVPMEDKTKRICINLQMN